MSLRNENWCVCGCVWDICVWGCVDVGAGRVYVCVGVCGGVGVENDVDECIMIKRTKYTFENNSI